MWEFRVKNALSLLFSINIWQYSKEHTMTWFIDQLEVTKPNISLIQVSDLLYSNWLRLWMSVIFFFFFLFFRDKVSLCSPGCPETHFVDQAGLELRNPPASASLALMKFLPFRDQQSFFLFFFKNPQLPSTVWLWVSVSDWVSWSENKMPLSATTTELH